MSDTAATIGLRPAIRAIWASRTTRTTWSSIQAASTGTTRAGITAIPFVLSQNKKRAAQPSAVAKRQNRGDARRHRDLLTAILVMVPMLESIFMAAVRKWDLKSFARKGSRSHA